MTDRKLMQLAQPEQPIQTATYTCGVCGVSMQMEQPKQEPVGRLESDPYEGHVFVPRIDGDWSMLGEDLYTAPPQRKPLTENELFKLWVSVPAETEDRFAFARAIEAAHGIKGEA